MQIAAITWSDKSGRFSGLSAERLAPPFYGGVATGIQISSPIPRAYQSSLEPQIG